MRVRAEDHINETRTMHNGMKATILDITGRYKHGIALYKVQFEDGSIVDGVQYSPFKRGNVAHPRDNMIAAEDRVGEIKTMNNGMKARLGDITGRDRDGSALYKVIFNDGSVADGVLYGNFKHGRVAHPKDKANAKIGEERVMNNGMKARISDINGRRGYAAQYKVTFEDGSVVEGVLYQHFKRGNVAHPSYRPDAPKGERDIAEILTAAGFKAGVDYIWEYIDENFTDNGRKRYMDFYIPNLKLFIEFNGQQHFEYIPFYHDVKEDGTCGRDGYSGFWAFCQEKAIDDFKWRTCKSIGCELWYFADDEPYTEGWRYPVHTIDELPKMLADRIGKEES